MGRFRSVGTILPAGPTYGLERSGVRFPIMTIAGVVVPAVRRSATGTAMRR